MGFSNEYFFRKGHGFRKLSDHFIFKRFPDNKIPKTIVNYSINKHF